MARTPSVSDEEVITTAHQVLNEFGTNKFSLSAVANKLSISRAALILRFENTDNLLTLASQANFEKFKHHFDNVELSNDNASLLRLAACFAELVKTKSGASRFLENHFSRAKNKGLEKLDYERGEFVEQLIERALPMDLLSQPGAVRLFNNFLTGTIVEWLTKDETESSHFFKLRTEQWLACCGQGQEKS